MHTIMQLLTEHGYVVPFVAVLAEQCGCRCRPRHF